MGAMAGPAIFYLRQGHGSLLKHGCGRRRLGSRRWLYLCDTHRDAGYARLREMSDSRLTWREKGSHETSVVGQYCDLLLPTDGPDRQCKRLSRRRSIGRRCRAYDPPYLSRDLWWLCWWMVRAPPLMASRHPNGNLNQFADDYQGWLPAGWDERLRTAGDASPRPGTTKPTGHQSTGTTKYHSTGDGGYAGGGGPPYR